MTQDQNQPSPQDNTTTDKPCCPCHSKWVWIPTLVILVLLAFAAFAYYYYFHRPVPSLTTDKTFINLSEIAAPVNTKVFFAFQPDTQGKLYALSKKTYQNFQKNPATKKFLDEINKSYGIIWDPKLFNTLDPQGMSLMLWPLQEDQSLLSAVKTTSPDGSAPFGLAALLNLGPKASVAAIISQALSSFQNQEEFTAGKGQIADHDVSFLQSKAHPGLKLQWSFWNELLVFATNDRDMTTVLNRLDKGTNDLAQAPLYQKTKTTLAQNTETLFFANLENMFKQTKQDPKAPLSPHDQFLNALQYLNFSMGTQGNVGTFVSNLVWDPTRFGPIGEALTTIDQTLTPQYSKLASQSATYTFSLNARALWQMVTKIVALYPALSAQKSSVLAGIFAKGVDIDKDILANITGELSLIIELVQAKPEAPQNADPAAMINNVMKMFEHSYVMIGTKNSAALKDVLQKLMGPTPTELADEPYQNYTLTNLGQFAIASSAENVLVAMSPDALKGIINQAQAGNVLEKKGLYNTLSGSIDNKTAFLQMYLNFPAYADYMAGMLTSSVPTDKPEMAKLVDDNVKALQMVKELYGDTLTSYSIEKDGIKMLGAMELK